MRAAYDAWRVCPVMMRLVLDQAREFVNEHGGTLRAARGKVAWREWKALTEAAREAWGPSEPAPRLIRPRRPDGSFCSAYDLPDGANVLDLVARTPPPRKRRLRRETVVREAGKACLATVAKAKQLKEEWKGEAAARRTALPEGRKTPEKAAMDVEKRQHRFNDAMSVVEKSVVAEFRRAPKVYRLVLTVPRYGKMGG